MKVLSLFDGMSCGQLALKRAGIHVEKYYASEIDKYAIQITQKNFPETIQLGDVCNLNPDDFMDVDLILCGSPCQGFSFAGKQLAFDDPRSALFFEFIKILQAIKPKYFLLENVPMKLEFLQIITEQVSLCYPDYQGDDLFSGVIKPISINSSLVSAQSRQRYYWTNIPGVEQPEDKGIILRDILETDAISDEFIHGQKSVDYMNRGNEKWEQAGNRRADRYEQSADKEKSFAITANWHKGVPYNYFKETKPKQVGGRLVGRSYDKDGKRADRFGDSVAGKTIQMLELRQDEKSNTLSTAFKDTIVVNENLLWRKLTPLECERLQTVPDNYTKGVSNTRRYQMLGNGWTVDVIAHILKNMDERQKPKQS